MGEALFDIIGGPWALDFFFWFWFLKGVWGLFVKGHHGLGVQPAFAQPFWVVS
jgi:hypothetical protein